MKCILIDVKNKEVKEVILDKEKKTIKQWYEHIGCDMVETGTWIDETNSIMVDEEGLLKLKHDSMFFTYKGGHQPFCGNGLVVGCNNEGESVSTTLTVEYVKERVKFHTLEEVRRMG